MIIGFANAKLEKVCNNTKALIKAHGPLCAKKIGRRLDDLRAASSLEEFRRLPGRCHELRGDRKRTFSLDLEHPYRLLFRPAKDGPEVDARDGGIDWSKVDAVEILAVEDTHG